MCRSAYLWRIVFVITLHDSSLLSHHLYKTSHRNFKKCPYACRMAVCQTMSHWGNRSSLLSRTACVPLHRWSAPCCALWSSPPLCWHGQVCQGPHRCLKSRLHQEITRHGAMKPREWRVHPLECVGVFVCVHRWILFKLAWQKFTIYASFLSSR